MSCADESLKVPNELPIVIGGGIDEIDEVNERGKGWTKFVEKRPY